MKINEVRKDLFASKNKLVLSLQTYISCSLYKHALRATYQAGHIWGNALKPEVSIPCPSSWGCTKEKESWTPEWSAVTAIWSQLRFLDHCGCISGCETACGCRRVSLPCTAQCKSCKGGCTNQNNFWDCLILHALLIHMTMFHQTTSIIHNPSIFFHYLLAGIEYLNILDFFINMKTGYTLKKTRQVVMNPADILIHYLSTNCFINAMSAIPFENLLFLRLGKNINNPVMKANAFVCSLRMISIIHLVKLFYVSEYWAKDRGCFRKTFTFKFIRIIVVGLIVVIKVLALIAAITVLHFVLTKSHHGFYLGELIEMKYHDEKDEYFWVFLLLSRVCKSLFLFGYSLQPNPKYIDQITAMLTYSVAFVFHFWAAVVVYNCVARESSLDDYVSISRSQTLTILRMRRLPDVMHTKVIKYFDFKASYLPVVETRNSLFHSLPPMLKLEIKMSCYRSLVTNIPYFSEWPPEVICGIVELLNPQIYMDGDVVSSARHERESLAVVEAGLLAAYSGREEIAHYVDGDYFGEHALVADHDTAGVTIVALSASMVLLLDKVRFQELMKHYPELFNELKMKCAASDQILDTDRVT